MPSEKPTCPMPRSKLVERYFMEHRAKLIDVAAFLDRLDRAADDAEGPRSRGGQREEDFRIAAFRRALVILQEDRPGRVKRIMEFFSDPTDEPIDKAPMQGALGAYPGPADAGEKKKGSAGKKTKTTGRTKAGSRRGKGKRS